jgi:hypothetical protein
MNATKEKQKEYYEERKRKGIKYLRTSTFNNCYNRITSHDRYVKKFLKHYVKDFSKDHLMDLLSTIKVKV